ncbi:MAG TPA: dethiobiotin synthase, partial [Planctomycetaceae bacterium]
PVAARQEGRTVDPALLRSGAEWWAGRCDLLLVEGVGGLLCPLTEDETVADLAADLGLPLLVVARATLGTINHTLLTVEAARTRNLDVAGIILNESVPADGDASVATNAAEIERRSGVPILGIVPHGRPARLLVQGTGQRIDWRTLACRVGPPLPRKRG